MSKQLSDLPLFSIVPFVRKLRPAAATGYRLLDGQNRLFPPLEQPPYHARARIDTPDVPPGLYGIRFEDPDGNNLAYTDDGSLAEIQLDGGAVIQSPSAIEVHQERDWQGVEKHELRHRRKHIRNGSLQSFASMLNDAHGLLFESHREVKESQKYVADMVRNVMDLQRTMLEQQKAISVQAQAAAPPPPVENWASATPKILRELGDVVKVAMMATSPEREARTSLPAFLESQPKPATALEKSSPAASAEAPALKASAARSPASGQDSEPSASAPPLATAVATSTPAADPPVSTAQPAPLAPHSAPAVSAPLASAAPPSMPAVPAPIPAGESPAAVAPSARFVPPAQPTAAPAAAPVKSEAPPTEPPSASPPPPPPAPPPVPPSCPPPPAAAPPPSSSSAVPMPSPSPASQHARSVSQPDGNASLSRALPTAPVKTPPNPLASSARKLLWRLRCLMAQGLWKEIKRRIISLPDGTLHKAVSNRETFLAWLQWVAEPAKLLRGHP